MGRKYKVIVLWHIAQLYSSVHEFRCRTAVAGMQGTSDISDLVIRDISPHSSRSDGYPKGRKCRLWVFITVGEWSLRTGLTFPAGRFVYWVCLHSLICFLSNN